MSVRLIILCDTLYKKKLKHMTDVGRTFLCSNFYYIFCQL